MDKALHPKSRGGVMPQSSPLHRTQKAAFGAALLSRGEASLCPACAAQGPPEK